MRKAKVSKSMTFYSAGSVLVVVVLMFQIFTFKICKVKMARLC